MVQRPGSEDTPPQATPAQPMVDAFVPGLQLGYRQRLNALHAAKLEHTRIKREQRGPADSDDQGMIPLPPDASETVEAVSGSGVVVKDLVLKGFRAETNHPSGGFFGAGIAGENFRRLLNAHPTYIHPMSSMAGAYMVNFNSYRKPGWDPDFDYSHLRPEQEKYGIDPGIGGLQHFCPDLRIGLDLGWGGLLEKIRHYRGAHPGAADFYDGLEAVVLGMQSWIRRHAVTARTMAETETHPELRTNLRDIDAVCSALATRAPTTFREACQWLVFFQAAAKMYNGSGEWGQLDELLRPYFERDSAAGTLAEDEAAFHIACLLLSETAYIQLGGPDARGRDLTSRVSYLILEAIHLLKIPANIAVRVGAGIDPGLFKRGVEILFEDKMGFPKFVGDRSVTDGFVRNGHSLELARQRIYAGCHWLAVPGREYGMNDLIKIDLAKILNLSFEEMVADHSSSPTVRDLWARFRQHLLRAVDVVAQGIDFHLEHMHQVLPELVLDLFCHGPVEQGLDATNGGVELVNIGVDAASLATAADSFAALEQRVEKEEALAWDEIIECLDSDWECGDGERKRLLMRTAARFGSGESIGDEWALRIAQTFTEAVAAQPTPNGHRMTPGLFSWAKVIPFGKRLRATPNGRRAGEPVSHGPNPEPGFNEGRPGTPTQLVKAVAAVQPGLGNTAPLQLDLDPVLGDTAEGRRKVEALIQTHFDLGGTMVNINVLDRNTLLEAQRDPAMFPDLIVRVTGFSAYFASLSEDMRQYVIDRVVQGE